LTIIFFVFLTIQLNGRIISERAIINFANGVKVYEISNIQSRLNKGNNTLEINIINYDAKQLGYKDKTITYKENRYGIIYGLQILLENN
jgi:hypothetical protein